MREAAAQEKTALLSNAAETWQCSTLPVYVNASSCPCCAHLVVPRFSTQHLCALEARRQALGSECSACWEELHVDALPEVDKDQAVVRAL